jgi:hypothetical protein
MAMPEMRSRIEEALEELRASVVAQCAFVLGPLGQLVAAVGSVDPSRYNTSASEDLTLSDGLFEKINTQPPHFLCIQFSSFALPPASARQELRDLLQVVAASLREALENELATEQAQPSQPAGGSSPEGAPAEALADKTRLD